MNKYLIRQVGTQNYVMGFVGGKPLNYIAEKLDNNFIKGWQSFKVIDLVWIVEKDCHSLTKHKRAMISPAIYTDGLDMTNGVLNSNVNYINAKWELVNIKDTNYYDIKED